jgi:hypothetical protein
MVKIRIDPTILVVFVVLLLAILTTYFLISIGLNDMTTTSTLPKITTIITTTNPPEETTSTTTLPYSLRKRLLDLANANKGKCNVTYTQFERKHFPTSRWFLDVCSNFKNYNGTEIWRTDAYLNNKCNLGVADECIQVFTSISLDEKKICVWAIDQYSAKTISFGNLTQKYC